MANIRDIKTRIDSVTSTRQITNAMKMVAAAKLRKSQNRIVAARPYANHINEMLRILKKKNKTSLHPLLDETDTDGKRALIVVTADKGLCGSFNSVVLRRATSYLKDHPDVDVICLGKKGYEFLRKRHGSIVKHYLDLFNEMDFSVSKDVADYALQLYMEEDYSRIDVLYNEFKSAIQQDLVIKPLLPIIPTENEEVSTMDFVYEPDEDAIVEELGYKYIHVEIWRIMLESSAAEQGARMTAMDSATDNASDLISMLSLQYNRARQASITNEIIEIASGAEAINN